MRACGAMNSGMPAACALVGTYLRQKQLHLSKDGHSGLSLQAAQTLANFGAGEWLTRHTSRPDNKVYPGSDGGRTEKVNQQLQGIHVAVYTFPRPFQSLFATRR